MSTLLMRFYHFLLKLSVLGPRGSVLDSNTVHKHRIAPRIHWNASRTLNLPYFARNGQNPQNLEIPPVFPIGPLAPYWALKGVRGLYLPLGPWAQNTVHTFTRMSKMPQCRRCPNVKILDEILTFLTKIVCFRLP